MSNEVLLIHPPTFKGRVHRGKFFTPPMGLAYLAAALLDKKINVGLLDCDPEAIFINPLNRKPEQIIKFEKRLKELSPTPPILIGIGPSTTPNLLNDLEIAKTAKAIFPDSMVVIGGPHPSVMPPIMASQMIESYPFLDIVVIGEGEDLISEVFFSVRDKMPLEKISGIVFRKTDGTASQYNPRKEIKNLDKLPFPARNLFRPYQKNYRLSLRRNLSFRFSDNFFSEHAHPAFAVMFTTRGCPYHCKFCCAPKGRRVRSPRNVIAEIEECVIQDNIRIFVFYDDLFATSSNEEKRRVVEFCNLLKEKNLNIYWEVELRADVICKLGVDILKMMYQTGCSVVNIGIEKGFQDGLDYLNKQVELEQITHAVQMLRMAGNFIVNGLFILGGSNESKSNINSTIEFAINLGLNFADFHVLEIHPGTDLFIEAQESGLISDHWEAYQLPDKYPLYTSSTLSKNQLLTFQKTAYRKFYFRKDYILDRLRRIQSLSDVQLFFQEYAIWVSRSL